MLRIIFLLSVLCLCAHANPRPGARSGGAKSGVPIVDAIMVREAVVVSVGEDAAIVEGRYTFGFTPDVGKPPSRYSRVIVVPVPIPSTLVTHEEVAAAVSPVLTLQGKTYRPEKEVRYSIGTSLPHGVKLARFIFRIECSIYESRFELELRYQQPIATIGEKELVFYVPYLPHFQQFAAKMGLREDSFRIRFQTSDGVVIRQVLPQDAALSTMATSLDFTARHNEAIAVERQKPNKAPEPTPGSVTPRATEGTSK